AAGFFRRTRLLHRERSCPAISAIPRFSNGENCEKRRGTMSLSSRLSAALCARHWSHPHGEWHRGQLVRKAGALAALHYPPVTLPEWKQEEARLRESLCRRLHLVGEPGEPRGLELQEHGEIAR